MRKFLLGIMAVVMGGMIMAAPAVVTEPVYATKCYCSKEDAKNKKNEGVTTSVLGSGKAYDENGKLIDGLHCSCDDGEGSEVVRILELVVSIMTIGVGILGVTGIIIVGVQYLTAGGSEEQTKKAKKRLVEIVIGLVAYALIFALLNFLIPDFKPFNW